MKDSKLCWIGMADDARGRSAPMFRKEFKLAQNIKSAQLKICGLGYYEAFINGKRIGDHVLDPAQTDYEKRCFFVSHDVTGDLVKGANAIGVIVGDGWYNQDIVWAEGDYSMKTAIAYGAPRLWAELTVQYSDDSTFVISTDKDWKCSSGPITSNNIYAGETYDARLEMPGWDAPRFEDSKWQAVKIVDAPGGWMEKQIMPPIKKIQEIKPVSIIEVKPGIFVADMGQNFSGWARIRIQAKAGTKIQLKFAEASFADGMIDTASTGVFATKVEQTDIYICKGSGIEIWEPRFTYHGFRYVEVTGWNGTPGLEDITGVVVHTALEQAGSFECSDPRLNQLHNMALWTHRSNVHSIPEDCPARERCGWLGDAHVVCEYSLHNFKSQSFWEKYLDDIETTRARFDGLPGYIAPGKRTWSPAAPDWMAAFILVPWFLYVYCGKRKVLERHWNGMRTVIEHFGKKSENWILSGGLGDWCDPMHKCNPTYTKEVVTTTMWFWRCSDIMAHAAGVLAKIDDAKRYSEWAANIATAFKEKFYDKTNQTYGSQTANAMALQFGLIPAGEKQSIVHSLVKDIEETHKMHHSVGIMGLRFLFEVLTRYGHGDIALALLHQDTYPSYGDVIKRGATTLWEYWGEPEIDKAEGPRSLSHPMMGGFDNWFYNTLAGIMPDPANPGFKHFFLEPHPVPGLDWVRAHHDCPHGRIVSEWKMEGGKFHWNVTVPAGTTATAKFPVSGDVRELQSGSYSF